MFPPDEQILYRLSALENGANVPRRRASRAAVAAVAVASAYRRYPLEEAVTVQPLTSGAIAWTEFDCSPHLPSGAVEAELVVEAALDSDTLMRRRVYARTSDAAETKTIAMLRGGAGDNVGCLTPAVVGLYRDEGKLSFQHSQDDFRSVADPADPAGVTILLVGYYA